MALEPETAGAVPPTPETPHTVSRGGVTSHVTSQQPQPRSNVIDFPKENWCALPAFVRSDQNELRRATGLPAVARVDYLASVGWCAPMSSSTSPTGCSPT